MAPNTTYAYAIGELNYFGDSTKPSITTSGAYAGGRAAIIPPTYNFGYYQYVGAASSGALFLSANAQATFDVGLTPVNNPPPQPVLGATVQQTGGNTNIVFTWIATVGAVYQFQTSTDLSNGGNWQNYMTAFSATNSTMIWSDVISTNQQLYYRLVIE